MHSNWFLSLSPNPPRRFIRFYPSFDIEGDNDDRPSSEISPKTILPTTPDLNRLLHFLLVCPKDASYTVAIFPVYHYRTLHHPNDTSHRLTGQDISLRYTPSRYAHTYTLSIYTAGPIYPLRQEELSGRADIANRVRTRTRQPAIAGFNEGVVECSLDCLPLLGDELQSIEKGGAVDQRGLDRTHLSGRITARHYRPRSPGPLFPG